MTLWDQIALAMARYTLDRYGPSQIGSPFLVEEALLYLHALDVLQLAQQRSPVRGMLPLRLPVGKRRIGS